MPWQLTDSERPWRVLALPSLRVQVSPTRIRVADVCIVERDAPEEQTLTHPPLAVIEVVDEDDKLTQILRKLKDYAEFGIGYIWVIDADSHATYRYVSDALMTVDSDVISIPGKPVRVVLRNMFADVDQRKGK